MANEKKQTNFGQLIHDHCYIAQKTVKQLAIEVGITESEMRGIASGRLPTSLVLIKFLNWLSKEVAS